MKNETKRLYRLEEGKIIGGVCAGLGEYFNIDPTLIRLLWVLVFFMGGSGLLLYIIFWIVLPVKKNRNEQESKKKMKDKEIEKEKNEENTNPDYFFAFLLIFAGLVLLLNTTGVITWGIWSILWRFWPLVLVFIGLNLIIQENRILKIVIGILSILALILVFLWSWGVSSAEQFSKSFNIDLPAWVRDVERTPDMREVFTITSEEYPEINAKSLNIDMGVGDLRIESEDSENVLFLESKHYRNFGEPDLQETLRNRILEIDIDLGSRTDFFLFNVSRGPSYILKLGHSDISTDLFLKLGAGRANIELENYNIENMNLEVGAGKTEANLSNMSIEKIEMEIGAGQLILRINEEMEIREPILANVGAGDMRIEIPENFGYEINGTIGVGSVQLRERSFSGLGQEISNFRSENYDTAEYILKFEVDTGVGRFTIR
jgi:phage shock protein C